jgi:hypothetical protein
MNNHKKMTNSINQSIEILRETNNLKETTSINITSISDEFKKLTELNKEGVITDEEYKTLKERLIK